MQRFLLVLLTGITAATLALADNWPAWRGATGQGHCAEKNVPLKWSDKDNVKWKIKLKDQGNSTPVIWGERIFVTQANKGGSIRSLMCYDRADGKLLWQKDVEYAAQEPNWNQSWYANASPAVDGKLVVVSFGSAGVYCYDFDGKELWKRTDLGKWHHSFGNSASPVLHDDLVIQWCGVNDSGRNFLLAAKKQTGETVWETDEKMGSWSTPLIVKVNGQEQIIVGMSRDVKGAEDPKTGHLKGYDVKTGKEIWSCQGMNSYVYTSALYSNGVAVGMSGYGGAALAVKLGGTGDITKDRLWHHPKNIQRVGSGTIVGEHVYMVDENSMPRCYELATGTNLWEGLKRPGNTTWGSLVHADGRLYTLLRDGTTVVFAANPEKFEVLATNPLKGEQTNSSLAISNGEIFIRTFGHLWCISEKK